MLAGLPSGYDVDDRRYRLGEGRALFERVCDALFGWHHFRAPWVELHGDAERAHPGQAVATLVRFAGLWFLNPCRVLYVENEATDCVAFAYGTLPGHVESGEERFEVRFAPADAAVTYRLLAFSRPALALTRVGYPIARRVQARFAQASAEALARAAGAAKGPLQVQ